VISGNCNVLMTDFDPEATTPVGDFAEPADNVPGTVEDTISFYWDSGAVEEFDWGDADDPTYPTLAQPWRQSRDCAWFHAGSLDRC
jgi:hypothetical protein